MTQPNAAEFFRLKVSGLPRSREDEFTHLCFEAGASGVAEELAFSQPDLVYGAEIVETPYLSVSVFFEEAPTEDALLSLQKEFPDARWEMMIEANRDWLAEWKKGFKPFRFAGDFWIVPSWLDVPAEAPKDPSRILFVEPGMAFGTGTHETTKLAAQYVVEEMAALRAPTVLDVGTGTGVLALVAKRLGASEVIGIDNDPESWRTARENLELNKEDGVAIPETQIGDIRSEFDLVIANIIDGVLMLLSQDLARVVKPGGRLVLSGILVERDERFYREFVEATGLRIVKTARDGDWSAAVLERSKF